MDELCPVICDHTVRRAVEEGWELDPPDRYCHRCGATAGPGSVTDRGCSSCVKSPMAWDRIIRLGAYHEPLSQWVCAMKFHGVWSWASWAGKQLAEQIGPTVCNTPTVICPVPMHWRRRVRRGYNQARLIAKAVAKSVDCPMVDWLHRVRHTPPQTHLPASRRSANVRGAITIDRVDLTGHGVWLIDDVKTTGATLGVCAKLLRRHGASAINVAVMAVSNPTDGE